MFVLLFPHCFFKWNVESSWNVDKVTKEVLKSVVQSTIERSKFLLLLEYLEVSGVLELRLSLICPERVDFCGSLSWVFSDWNFNKPGTWYFFFFPFFLGAEGRKKIVLAPSPSSTSYWVWCWGKWCCFLCLSFKWFRCPELSPNPYKMYVPHSFVSMEKVI